MKPPRQRVVVAVLWALLLTAPFWVGTLGGYTELATRVLVMALAAMALQSLPEIACTFARGSEWVACSTTNVGRFWFMLPSP